MTSKKQLLKFKAIYRKQKKHREIVNKSFIIFNHRITFMIVRIPKWQR